MCTTSSLFAQKLTQFSVILHLYPPWYPLENNSKAKKVADNFSDASKASNFFFKIRFDSFSVILKPLENISKTK